MLFLIFLSLLIPISFQCPKLDAKCIVLKNRQSGTFTLLDSQEFDYFVASPGRNFSALVYFKDSQDQVSHDWPPGFWFGSLVPSYELSRLVRSAHFVGTQKKSPQDTLFFIRTFVTKSFKNNGVFLFKRENKRDKPGDLILEMNVTSLVDMTMRLERETGVLVDHVMEVPYGYQLIVGCIVSVALLIPDCCSTTKTSFTGEVISFRKFRSVVVSCVVHLILSAITNRTNTYTDLGERIIVNLMTTGTSAWCTVVLYAIHGKMKTKGQSFLVDLVIHTCAAISSISLFIGFVLDSFKNWMVIFVILALTITNHSNDYILSRMSSLNLLNLIIVPVAVSIPAYWPEFFYQLLPSLLVFIGVTMALPQKLFGYDFKKDANIRFAMNGPALFGTIEHEDIYGNFFINVRGVDGDAVKYDGTTFTDIEIHEVQANAHDQADPPIQLNDM